MKDEQRATARCTTPPSPKFSPAVMAISPTTATLLKQVVYTPQDLEPLLLLSKNTINALLNSGRLRAVRCGRKWLIPRDALIEFLTPEAAQ